MARRPRLRARRRMGLLVGVTAALIALAAPSAAQATTFTVTSNADSGAGTLREQLGLAGAGDTILIPASFTITLATPLSVTQAAPGVAIGVEGSGRPTLSGNNATRIFSVGIGAGLTVNGLLLTGGIGGDGSAITTLSGASVTLSNSIVSGNGSTAASGDGGAIHMNSGGTLTIENSTVENNHGGSSSGNGGAIQLNSASTLNVIGSTIADNRAGPASGYGGAIQLNSDSTLNVTASTISGNTAGGDGGAIQLNSNSTLNLTNSTLVNNSGAGNGGAIQFNSPATGSILNSTISGNHATGPTSLGGGLEVNLSPANSISVKNTIVAGNTAPNGANCGFPMSAPTQLSSAGHNDENGTSCGFTAAGDLNADPMLGPLQSNGGPTSTLALTAGSPAIDAADNDGCPAADQRGQVRPVDGGTGRGLICDIGAYEVSPSNAFSFGKLKRNRRKGTATLTVNVPGPGTLALTGKGLVKQRPTGASRIVSAAAKTVSAAGKVKLKVRSKGKKKRKLNRTGKVKVKAKATYTPTGGDPNTKPKRIKLIKRH